MINRKISLITMASIGMVLAVGAQDKQETESSSGNKATLNVKLDSKDERGRKNFTIDETIRDVWKLC
jgi:hypothetical protein